MPSNSQIVIKFPSSITLTAGSCSISSVGTGGISSTATCNVASNTMTISKPFGSTGSYTAGGAAFSFILSPGGANPVSVADAGEFDVSTNYIDTTGASYPIDSN